MNMFCKMCQDFPRKTSQKQNKNHPRLKVDELESRHRSSVLRAQVWRVEGGISGPICSNLEIGDVQRLDKGMLNGNA